jgi:hypothetical protein
VADGGKIETGGRKWKISRALLPVEERILVYYCATLVRELDPAIRRSTIVERLKAEKQNPIMCKGCPGTFCKPCCGT